MPRRRIFAWGLVLPALCLPGLLGAQNPQRPASAEVTFTLKDADRSADWPVAIRQVTIGGRPVRFDRPARAEGDWLSTVAITLVNVSPKTMVRAGMDITFPESGDGSSQRPYLGLQWVKGRVPKIVYRASDGYHLPPYWDHDAPLQLAPGGVLHLSFDRGSPSTRAWLARAAAIRAVLSWDTFYFGDNSRWSAGEYALPPAPPSRAWTMVSKETFVRSAQGARSGEAIMPAVR